MTNSPGVSNAGTVSSLPVPGTIPPSLNLLPNNFSIDFIKSRILGIINKYLNYNEILLQIEANILNETNIEEFITNFNNINNLTILEIKEVILTTNQFYWVVYIILVA